MPRSLYMQTQACKRLPMLTASHAFALTGLSLFSLLGACHPTSTPPETAAPTEATTGLTASRGAPRETGKSIEFPYAENFEGLENGSVPFGWEGKGDDSAFAKVLSEGFRGARSGGAVVHLSDDSAEDAAELTTSFDERSRGMVQYALLISRDRAADAYMTLAFGDQSTERVVDVLFTQSGTVRYRSGNGSLVDVQPYEKDMWHDVSVVWDLKHSSFVLTIDGVQAGTFPLGSTRAPDQITFKVGSNDKTKQSAYIDDVQLVFE